MTTIAFRGLIACAFIASSSLLTGMVALPSGGAASEPFAAGAVLAQDAGPGLLDRVRLKACQISLAATRSDRSASRERSRQCGE